MKEQQLTAAEETAKRIAEMPLHKDYKFVPDLPIPTGYGVLIRPIIESVIQGTGLIIPTDDGSGGKEFLLSTQTDKNKNQNVGIIYAIGSKCGPGLRVGLKCRYLYQEGMMSFRHGLEEYIITDEMGVPFIIPSDDTSSKGGLKTDREVGRENRQERQKRTFEVDKVRDDADANKLEDTKRTRKIHIIKTK